MNQSRAATRSGGSRASDDPRLVLDIKGGTLAPGTPLIVWGRNSPASPNQLWTLTSDGYLQCRADPDLVLDVQGGDLVPGTPLIVWGRNSPRSPNQMWALGRDGHLLVGPEHSGAHHGRSGHEGNNRR
jgi:hypothetical protein